MPTTKNILLPAAANKPIALDIFYKENASHKPVVIYAHGFNGFKDWSNFDIIARRFAENGFVLVKFNFSRNGTSPAHPEEFVDLEAFGNNNYTKQLEDLQRVIDWVCDAQNLHSLALLQQWQPKAGIFIVESDHVFGRKHPWESEALPPATEEVVAESVRFLSS